MKIKLFGREFEFRSGSPDIRRDAAWTQYLRGAGYSVSAKTALQVATVIRCVDVVAKTMASLPLNLYRQTENGKIRAETHLVNKLLHRLPNPETTAFEFWLMYVYNLMLTPAAYAKVIRDQNGVIMELWNIPTAAASIRRNAQTGERYLEVRSKGAVVDKLYPASYMYTPGARFGDPDSPEDPIAIAANVLGLTMALDMYAKDYFDNGTNLGGIVEYPGVLKDEAYKRFKESWNETYAGVKNQHKIAFLESGFKFSQLGRNPEESQSLESRQFQVLEICRVMGVPPHKVFEMGRATYANAEQANIEYVQECLSPMAVRLEQTIYKDLLTSSEQRRHYAKFNLNGLLRGDTATRTAYYHNMRQDGVMSANEIRELEEMNSLPESLGGDVIAINGNMIPLNSVPQNLPKGAMKGGTNG